MNSGHLEANDWLSPEVADTMQRRVAAGEARATVARDFRVPQGLISAVARGAAIYDELYSAETAATWLQEHGVLPPGESIDEPTLASLVQLREVLRSAAEANTQANPMSPETVAELNAFAESAPLVVRFTPEPSGSGLAGREPASPVAWLVAALFESMRDGSWKRLKRCPGHGCPFTFYDSSRNRTGTWCSMSVCGNRAKVRSYQQRRRAGKPTPSR